MSTRDDYPHLAWQAANHARTELGRQSARALDEIDRLTALVDKYETNNMGIGQVIVDNDRLRAALDHAQLASIEARNPGIDMEEVKRLRATK